MLKSGFQIQVKMGVWNVHLQWVERNAILLCNLKCNFEMHDLKCNFESQNCYTSWNAKLQCSWCTQAHTTHTYTHTYTHTPTHTHTHVLHCIELRYIWNVNVKCNLKCNFEIQCWNTILKCKLKCKFEMQDWNACCNANLQFNLNAISTLQVWNASWMHVSNAILKYTCEVQF